MKKYIILFVSFYGFCVYGQQESQFTQYMYNTMSINPAYAGNRENVIVNLLHRSQWQGIAGAPKTQVLTIESPLMNNLGAGATILRDEAGPAFETTFAVDFAYTLRLNDSETLFSFGMKGGIQSLDVDFTRLNVYDPSDNLAENNIKKMSPIIGIGTYLYGDNWYVGVSIPNLLKTTHLRQGSNSKIAEKQHFYMISGYVFELNKHVKFKPTTLLKLTTGAPIAFDVATNFLIKDKLTLGASYRLNASINGLMGFQVSDKLMLGYAYDYDLTDIGTYNSGSHEFFMRYTFIKSKYGKVSPRFF